MHDQERLICELLVANCSVEEIRDGTKALLALRPTASDIRLIKEALIGAPCNCVNEGLAPGMHNKHDPCRKMLALDALGRIIDR